jgi:uncharacterized protein YkwD
MDFGTVERQAPGRSGLFREVVHAVGLTLTGLLVHLWELSMRRPDRVSRYGRACLTAVAVVVACAPAATVTRPSSAPTAGPTAPAQRDFVRLQAEVLDALNRARTRPAAMATEIESRIPYFEGTRFRRPGASVTILTVEGAAAVREAVTVLRSSRAVPELGFSAVLANAARDHVADQGRTGAVGHAGSDGSTTTTRVARHGTWQVSMNESIAYGSVSAGAEVIENLIIDDGVKDRGHRRNLYDPTSRLVGIACGPHPKYAVTCVIVQAGGVQGR